MSNIINILKEDGGYLYKLKTPIPIGGYSIFLNGRNLELNLLVSEYFYRSNSITPPPLEITKGGELFFSTPSLYAGNSTILTWRHVYGMTHYQIEISIDGGEYLICDTFLYSGGMFCEFRAEDISKDCIVSYRITPGIMVEGLFTPMALPIINSSFRVYIPPPPRAKISGYNSTTKTISIDKVDFLL